MFEKFVVWKKISEVTSSPDDGKGILNKIYNSQL